MAPKLVKYACRLPKALIRAISVFINAAFPEKTRHPDDNRRGTPVLEDVRFGLGMVGAIFWILLITAIGLLVIAAVVIWAWRTVFG
jgi:hypothetical protein